MGAPQLYPEGNILKVSTIPMSCRELVTDLDYGQLEHGFGLSQKRVIFLGNYHFYFFRSRDVGKNSAPDFSHLQVIPSLQPTFVARRLPILRNFFQIHDR